MADRDPLPEGPQRRAVPRMLVFLAALVLVAIGVLLWFTPGH